jgi:hypothetical protein
MFSVHYCATIFVYRIMRQFLWSLKLLVGHCFAVVVMVSNLIACMQYLLIPKHPMKASLPDH